MPEKVRVGLIGAGFVGNIHARAYCRITDLDVDIAAVAAVPFAQAEELAQRYGVANAYDDYRRILERDDINLVDLAVPNHLHEPFTIEAAEAVKLIKPRYAIPMHYGREIAGSRGHGQRFCQMVNGGIEALELPLENENLEGAR